VQFAPRFPPKLLDVIERLATARSPIAEINRRVGAEAERLGLARPSYQRVRVLVHEARDLQRLHTPAGDPLLEIATRTLSSYTVRQLATHKRRERLRDRIPK
jgi:hypothetical protein